MIAGIIAGGFVAAGGPPPGDGIEFVGYATSSKGSDSGSWTIDLSTLTGGIDTTPREGDFVIIVAAHSWPSNRDMTLTGTGWTEQCDLYANDTNDTNFAVFTKLMDATPDSSVIVSDETSNVAVVYVFRGVDASSPLDVAVTTATGTSSNRPKPPAITPVTTGAVIVVTAATTLSYGDSQTFTHPDLSDLVQPFTLQSPTTNRRTYGLAGWLEWDGVGEYDAEAFGSDSSNGTNSWAACTLALRPA